ncbi:MAG: beta-ketoacyl-[acyl-carrier-protein] synthase II [Candidatus Omnitrophica bacterium CG07_land_8_20_14_0_80_50_8]|nr:MAG: beta-ketoacyl-[acyl-carrier-protein] synthase II [Candidatus Omnitrophica bacterium CG1_02_49_16]PIU40684.1 MAG: beta-ketoacyl-[acyl-carrier-protein] synthase II [Candidatus Omnitrophica bacterium CG07_land_8_20_14_0_80_50_8]
MSDKISNGVYPRVVVTGVGTVSPIGNNASDFWHSLITGKSGVDKIKAFDPSRFGCQIAAEVKHYDPKASIPLKESRRMEQFSQFAVTAAKEAFKDSGIDMNKENPFEVGVVVGSGMGSLRIIEETHSVYLAKGPDKFSPFMIPLLIINMAAGWISILLGLKGPNLAVVTACASGTHAIGEAYRMIQHGQAKVMIAGGTESCITPLGIGGFCALKALSKRNDDPKSASRPFDKERDGFVMGEGAGLVVLEELEHAKARKAHLYGELAGYGLNGDAYHMTAPRPDGEGAAYCMKQAINDARMRPEDITYINAHGTSTELNDKVETLAIKTLFKDYAKKVQISSTKSMTGHTLGAAGGIEFVVCCLSLKHQTLHPTINQTHPDPECDLDYIPNTARKTSVEACLSNSLGFGGHNASILVKRFRG